MDLSTEPSTKSLVPNIAITSAKRWLCEGYQGLILFVLGSKGIPNHIGKIKIALTLEPLQPLIITSDNNV